MSVVILKHNTLVNRAEVKEFGWSKAKYEMRIVAESEELDSEGRDAAELAYLQSQSMEKHWHDSASHFWKLYFNTKLNTRSTSVDDILQVDGVEYKVNSFGFSVVGE